MTKLNWNGKIVSSQSEFSVTHRILRHTWPMLCTVMIFYPGRQPKCKNATCTHLAKRSSTEAKRERCLYCHLFLLLLCDCASTFWGVPEIQDHLCRKQRMLIYLTVRFFGFFFKSYKNSKWKCHVKWSLLNKALYHLYQERELLSQFIYIRVISKNASTNLYVNT